MNKTLIFLIQIYKRIISNTLSILFGGGCRFTPTCSEYSKQALEKYGTINGIKLSIIRLVRCNPFSKSFGWDPVK